MLQKLILNLNTLTPSRPPLPILLATLRLLAPGWHAQEHEKPSLISCRNQTSMVRKLSMGSSA